LKRFRLRYARSDKLKFLSHLDMMRLWPRVFRRAGIEVAYSEGFSGHPRLAIASPLAVGWTGEAELMEVWLENPPPPTTLLGLLAAKAPEGLTIDQGITIPPDSPSLQSLVRFAEYRVTLPYRSPAEDINAAVVRMMALSTLDWRYERDGQAKNYDLRAQINELSVISGEGEAVIFMRLKNDPSGSGRPEQVALALGFSGHPVAINRTRLVLA